MQVDHLTKLMGESFADAVSERLPGTAVAYATCMGQRFALTAVCQADSLGPVFLAMASEAWVTTGLGGSNPFPYGLVPDRAHPVGLRIVRGAAGRVGQSGLVLLEQAEPLAVHLAITTCRDVGEVMPLIELGNDWVIDISELMQNARGIESIAELRFVEAQLTP